MENDFANNARSVIANNVYLSLATASASRPWVSPVYYDFDEDFSFYFVSTLDSLHVQNILANPQVAVAIYDSTQPARTGMGVQIEGIASMVKEDEIPMVIGYLYKRRFPLNADQNEDDLSPTDFFGESLFRLFKIVPQHIYTRDTRFRDVDHRIEVKLTR
jgi:uncharacterized protein YhbP (UPF0306 family)